MDRENVKEILYALPLALIIGVTPLIVHYKKIKLGKVVASYWTRDVNTDFFSYYKMWAFLLFVLLGLIAFYIYFKKEKKIKKTIYYIPIAVYMLMIVISTAFSECKLTSLYGFPDRYEGMPVLLGYMFVLILAINLINSKKQIKFLLSILLISAVIIGIIGLYQFFGMNLFKSFIGQKLILPESGFEEIVSKLNYRFDKKDLVYATFYNPNYVGSYFVMLFILTLVMYLFAEKREKKILLGAVNLLMFACWLGSLSRAGIIGGLFSFLLLSVLIKDEIKKRWRSVLIIIICFIIVFTFMDVHSGGKLKREFISLGSETKIALKGKKARIKDIKLENGYLLLATKDNILKLSFDKTGNLVLRDGQDNKLDLYVKQKEKDKKKYLYIKNTDYENFRFRLMDNILFEVHLGSKQINIIADSENNNFCIVGINNNIYPIQNVESWSFKDKERFASGRGYIWSRSLPLLKRTLIKGLGPDTYAIYFPQQDVIGKLITYGTAAKIVDKPHNMYLQIALNTGLISLIAVIILFGVYFLRALKTYWNNKYNNWFSRIGIGIYGAFTAYAVAGIFNDSMVSIAPVFWTLMGLGLLIELKLKNNDICEL